MLQVTHFRPVAYLVHAGSLSLQRHHLSIGPRRHLVTQRKANVQVDPLKDVVNKDAKAYLNGGVCGTLSEVSINTSTPPRVLAQHWEPVSCWLLVKQERSGWAELQRCLVILFFALKSFSSNKRFARRVGSTMCAGGGRRLSRHKRMSESQSVECRQIAATPVRHNNSSYEKCGHCTANNALF